MQGRNGTNLTASKLTLKLDLVVMTTALCSAVSPFYVTVKGQRERSTAFTAESRCISGVVLSHAIYRLNSENWQPKHPSTVYCYLMEGGVWVFLPFFSLFFFLNKVKLRHSSKWTSWSRFRCRTPGLKTRIRRHLIRTECTVKVGWACLRRTERRQQHSTSDPKCPRPHTHTNTRTHKIRSILSMHVKVKVLL